MTRPIGKKLLVALDGTPHALSTVSFVGRMMSNSNTSVVLYHVFSTIPESFRDIGVTLQRKTAILKAEIWLSQVKKQAEECIEMARAELRRNGFPDNAIFVKMNEMKVGPAQDILAETRKDEYQAVVVGRKTGGYLKELVLGSVAGKLLQKLTKIPLLIAGPDVPNRKVLLAVDGSEASRRMVDIFAHMFSGVDLEVSLFHVVRSLNYAVEYDLPITEEGEEELMVKDHIQAIREFMDEARNILTGQGFKEESIDQIINTSAVSRAGSILKEARDKNYGLIVIGRRGASEGEDYPMGKVTAKLVQMARKRSMFIVA